MKNEVIKTKGLSQSRCEESDRGEYSSQYSTRYLKCKDGRINQFEVPSKTDDPEKLQERINTATKKFSPAKHGENRIIEITEMKGSQPK